MSATSRKDQNLAMRKNFLFTSIIKKIMNINYKSEKGLKINKNYKKQRLKIAMKPWKMSLGFILTYGILTTSMNKNLTKKS